MLFVVVAVVVVVLIGFELDLLRQGAAAMLVRSLPKEKQ